MVDMDEVENLEFKWGKKRGIGGKKKDVQFYESFAYDGMEYVLFDSVYLYKEGEPEPYIGKLIKIWENADKSKKVKVLWFFRPCEILSYLGDEETPENELFLASGEGVGLANVNPLEAIAGKCNVVCISKDSRNPQPSDEELQLADFVFYRTFDVGDCLILDKIDEKVAGIEVKFIFNRADSQKLSGVLNLDADKKEVTGNAAAIDETLISSKQNKCEESKTVKADGNIVDTLSKKNADPKASLTKQKPSLGKKPASGVGVESFEMAKANDRQERNSSFMVKENSDSKVSLVKQKSSIGEKPASSADGESDKLVKTDYKQEGDKTNLKTKVEEKADSKASLVKQKSSLGEKPASSVGAALGEMAKTNNRAEDISGGKTKSTSKVDSDRNDGKVGKVVVSQVEVEEEVKSTKDIGELDNRPSKKGKLDGSVMGSDDKNKNSVKKLNRDPDGNEAKAVVSTGTASEDKSRVKHARDSLGTDKVSSKKPKPDEKLTKLTNGKLPTASSRRPVNEDSKTDCQVLEVTRRPDAERSKWFKGLPWEERMQNAHEHGTLVLLQNLDPSYTSAEVEDIVWHAFKEGCTAKMIQRTAFSSPHSGQAFVIFKSREAAEMFVTKLDEGCLLLSNGRPVVGSIGNPCFPGKQSTYFGHLCIDKLKHQMQREMKEAVSTSHCSQPNTLEYDMAMEWCLLQERSDLTWEKLYKQQGQELRKLKANLKSK